MTKDELKSVNCKVSPRSNQGYKVLRELEFQEQKFLNFSIYQKKENFKGIRAYIFNR